MLIYFVLCSAFTTFVPAMDIKEEEKVGKDNPAGDIKRLLVKRRLYQDPHFSAQQLAEMMGISAFKLSRIIRTELGTTYTNIVHSLRVENAMRHLKDKRFAPYSIDDIGKMVGFNNRQSFFTAFKKITGTTPERFRQTPQ